jgi:hypothetical protein
MKRGEFMNDVMGRIYNPYYPYYQWNNGLNTNSVWSLMNSCYCKKSFFRVLNSYKDDLDVQVNEIIMAENLKEGELTRYVKFEPGTYEVKIFQSSPKKLIYESRLEIGQNLAYTGVIAVDDRDKNDISILMVPEAKEHSNTGKMSGVRLVNLVAEAPDMEFVASDGTILFSGIGSGDVSNNVAIPSGRYVLNLREKNSKNSVKTLNFDFAPGMHYTLYITGRYNDNSEIKVNIPEDGVNYLELC